MQADHVGELRDQLGTGGERERLDPPPRLHPMMAPGPQHRGRIDLQLRRQRPVRHAQLFGGDANVAARILARSTVRGRPDRTSSVKPSAPGTAYRARHEITV